MDILLVAEYALAEIGDYEVLMCEGGAEALEKIEEFKPDLIVLDVMMPEIDGPEVLSEIVELKACDANVISVIAKPFNPILISKTIQSAWDSFFSNNNKNSEAKPL